MSIVLSKCHPSSSKGYAASVNIETISSKLNNAKQLHSSDNDNDDESEACSSGNTMYKVGES